MYICNASIRNPLGLHARLATEFTAEAKKFKSRIFVQSTEKGCTVDGKSIVPLLSLALGKGSEIRIIAAGEDEEQAAKSLAFQIEFGF